MRQLLLTRLANLAVLLVALTTLLFFLLRATADQAAMLAGVDATPEQVAEIRAQYGLDRPLWRQYADYMAGLATLDFGESLVSGKPALADVVERLPWTLLLAALAMTLTLVLAIPIGAWLGRARGRPGPARRAASAVVFVLQGMPGFVVALLLIEIFAVELRWLPFIGNEGLDTWIMPTVTLASFLVPRLARVVAANVAGALAEDYVRTARAAGASAREILYRHALPNALLGATALVGTQFAFLLSGSVITESIFAWPGVGSLLVRATQNADFAVVQAVAIVIAILVFTVNAGADLAFKALDPRLRERRS
ncbi:MAG: ABC transporter permease [Pseudomonadota bacterium]